MALLLAIIPFPQPALHCRLIGPGFRLTSPPLIININRTRGDGEITKTTGSGHLWNPNRCLYLAFGKTSALLLTRHKFPARAGRLIVCSEVVIAIAQAITHTIMECCHRREVYRLSFLVPRSTVVALISRSLCVPLRLPHRHIDTHGSFS